MKVLNLYSSLTGNTAKVAKTIDDTLRAAKCEVETVVVSSEAQLNPLDYDLIFVGSGVYASLPDNKMMAFMEQLRKAGLNADGGAPAIKACAPRVNKQVVVYCTYGGVHTGINEAVPCVKLIGQLFDHYGFDIIAEWYVVGQFTPENMQHHNVNNRLGNIIGRPNEQDLTHIQESTMGILKTFNLK
jgi:multimeric flavodoxin WrbA